MSEEQAWVRPSGGIFINYRKGHHAIVVAALYERLARHFGQDRVFFDSRSMDPGTHYPDALWAKLRGSDVLIAIIDPAWLATLNARRDSGGRDWVHDEIEAALAYGTRKSVLPVLLDNTPLPAVDTLPPELKDLALRQVCRIGWSTFERDLTNLIHTLELMVAPSWTPPPEPSLVGGRHRGRRGIAGSAALGAAALLAPPIAADQVTGRFTAAEQITLQAGFLVLFSLLLVISGRVLSTGLLRATARLSRPSGRLRQLDPAAQRQFNLILTAGPLTVVLVLVALPVAMRHPASPQVALIAACFIVAFALVAALIVRSGPDQMAWPPSEQVTADEATLRRGVAALRAQLTNPAMLPTRELRDQTRWLGDQLARRVADVRRDAARTRLAWAIEDHAASPAGLTALACGTVSLTMTPFLPFGRGELGWWHAAPAVVGVLGAALVWAVLEVGYRAHGHHGTALADEISAELDELEGLLPQANEPSRVWIETPGNATEMPHGQRLRLAGVVPPGTTVEFRFYGGDGALVGAITTPPANWGGLVYPEAHSFDTSTVPLGRLTVRATFQCLAGGPVTQTVADIRMVPAVPDPEPDPGSHASATR